LLSIRVVFMVLMNKNGANFKVKRTKRNDLPKWRIKIHITQSATMYTFWLKTLLRIL